MAETPTTTWIVVEASHSPAMAGDLESGRRHVAEKACARMAGEEAKAIAKRVFEKKGSSIPVLLVGQLRRVL